MTTTYKKPCPSVCEIRISMDLALHPEFAKNPDKFAFTHNVDMTSCVLPETSFKTDRETGEKLAKKKANITIGPNDAIRLFVDDDGDGYRLRSIVVKPLELYLAHTNEELVPWDYLDTAFRLLKSHVAPLLAKPLDDDHILPGHADGHSVSYISHVKINALLSDIEIPCLHNLSHPLTGPAQGSTDKRITLCSEDGGLGVLLEKASWDEHVGDRLCHTEGINVTLTLTGKTLVSQFSVLGATKRVRGMKRLLRFCVLDVIYVFDVLMMQLGGIYLPVPPEWAAMGKAVTPAKTIALLSELTGIPVGEIRDMDKAIRKPSKSTMKRLNEDVAAAATCLKPVPVARLFGH
jgi:hypothetical protein